MTQKQNDTAKWIAVIVSVIIACSSIIWGISSSRANDFVDQVKLNTTQIVNLRMQGIQLEEKLKAILDRLTSIEKKIDNLDK